MNDKEMMHQVFGMQYGPGKKRREENNIHDVQKNSRKLQERSGKFQAHFASSPPEPGQNHLEGNCK